MAAPEGARTAEPGGHGDQLLAAAGEDGLGNHWLQVQATLAAVCVASGLVVTAADGGLAIGLINVATLLAFVAVWMVTLYACLGRPPSQLGWRWLLVPIAVVMLPALTANLMGGKGAAHPEEAPVRAGRPEEGDGTQNPRPAGSGPGGLPPTPPS